MSCVIMNCKSLKLVVLFVCVNILSRNQIKADVKSCKTQKNETGQCILLDQCAPLLELKRKKPYTADEENYLKGALCDFEEEIYAKVCCPVGIVYRTDSPKVYGEVDFVGPTTSPLLPDRTVCGPIMGERIEGGESTNIGDYPWMALLQYDTPRGKKFNCGGSLINNRYVLTAAHCVTGKVPREWNLTRVRLGEYNTTTEKDCIDTPEPLCSTPLDIDIEEKIVYAAYDSSNGNQYHDIALLRLAQEVVYTYFIKPICIPTTEDLINKTYAGLKTTVAGWGSTSTTASQSDVMLQLEVVVKSNDECQAVYRNRVNIGVGHLCAGGEEGKDSCSGDSGGPLMVVDYTTDVNYYVTGIVSFGPPCGLANWPGIYTRVSKYVPWIVNKLKP